MKKNLTACFLTTVLCAQAQTTSPGAYCAAGYDDPSNTGYWITSVKLGILDNTSGNTVYASPHYVFYNNVSKPDLAPGSTQTITVDHGEAGPFTHFFSAWIDYNQNNTFEANENIFNYDQMDPQIDQHPHVKTFTVPATAVPGVTRMRVMVMADDAYTYGTNPQTMPSCTAYAGGSFDWGETEDYEVKITGATAGTSDLNAATVSMFPNPVSDELSINVASEENPTITVTDCIGKTHNLDYTTTGANTQVDFSTAPAGIYFVTVAADGATYTQKVVKQ